MRVEQRIAAVLELCLGADAEGAFVYGSVAHGTAGPESDIDTFIVTRDEVPERQEADLLRRLAALQHELGYRPDEEHPAELFSIQACLTALDGPLVLRATDSAARDREIDLLTLEHDHLEILRALVDARLPIVESIVLDGLISFANRQVGNAAARHETSEDVVIRRLRAPKRPKGSTL